MKKIIVLLSIMFIFSACSRDYESEFELVYKVYYPTETCTYVKRFKGEENSSYTINSCKGSNYLYFSPVINNHMKDVYLYRGTAPVRLISFKRIK